MVFAVALVGSSCGGADDEVLEGALSEVVEVGVAGAEHVLGDVDYPTAPPAGGPHFGAWQNCGFYSVPLLDEVAVHSLEHGAVWVTFAPDIDPAEVGAIVARSAGESHLLASPHIAVDSGVVLSAWGRQLQVASWSDPAVEEFLGRYLGRRSPTAPEAGASCEGAIGAPPDDPMSNYDAAAAALMDQQG